MDNYFATQAFHLGNRLTAAQQREDDLLEALEEAEAEIIAWKKMYIKDVIAAAQNRK